VPNWIGLRPSIDVMNRLEKRVVKGTVLELKGLWNLATKQLPLWAVDVVRECLKVGPWSRLAREAEWSFAELSRCGWESCLHFCQHNPDWLIGRLTGSSWTVKKTSRVLRERQVPKIEKQVHAKTYAACQRGGHSTTRTVLPAPLENGAGCCPVCIRSAGEFADSSRYDMGLQARM
jgi:hypothetical protein